MGTRQGSLLGVGIYTISEAARMTGVSPGRIRRWMRGYVWKVRGETHSSPKLWTPELDDDEDSLALTFRDLIEVRFVDYFRSAGVSWKVLRSVSSEAAKLVGSDHPFSTQQFKTNGRSVFVEIGKTTDKTIRNVLSKQLAITTIVSPSLYRGLVFYKNDPARWFPLERSKRVVIDPSVAFGQPSVAPEGVPTAVLARAFKVEGSVERVAQWYRVPKPTVKAALRYEQVPIAA